MRRLAMRAASESRRAALGAYRRFAASPPNPQARRVWWLVPLAVASIAATSEIPWDDMTEADWIYPLATRFASVEGHRVHYPTPTVELAAALQARTENAALRHLAEA